MVTRVMVRATAFPTSATARYLSSRASPTFLSLFSFILDHRLRPHHRGTLQGYDTHAVRPVQRLLHPRYPKGRQGTQRFRERGERARGGGAILLALRQPLLALPVPPPAVQLAARGGVAVQAPRGVAQLCS